MQSDSDGYLRFAFAQNGFQYYLSARFCFISRLHYISGNLFHHAIEMFLKSGLLDSYNLVEIKKKKHDLLRLWKVFVRQFEITNDLSDENKIIKELDKFEKIRYPDFRCENGMELYITPIEPDISINVGKHHLSRFVLSLEQMDKLVIYLIDVCKINSKMLINDVPQESIHYLVVENKYSNRWHL